MADSHSKSVPCRTLRAIAERHSRHTEDTPIPFDLPAVHCKKITVDFNGGNQSSNAGLLLLREAERKRGVCQRLAAAIPDHRDPGERVRPAVEQCGRCLARHDHAPIQIYVAASSVGSIGKSNSKSPPFVPSDDAVS